MSHWEHGYRCHGLWLDASTRLALVSIGPSFGWDGTYRWFIDAPYRGEGSARTLRTAKRQAERCLAAQATPSSTDA